MECREYEKQVDSFLKNDMSDKEMLGFMEHVKSCPRCYEELEVYHSVYDGLNMLGEETMLEDSPEYVADRLEQLLNSRYQAIEFRKAKRIVMILFLAACAVGLAAFIWYLIR